MNLWLVHSLLSELAEKRCRGTGVGLRSWESALADAWFCSVASCIGLDDPNFDFARRALAKASRDAYELAVEALGGPP